MSIRSVFSELRRRRVIKVVAVYAVVVWVVMQVADIVFPALGFPEWTIQLVVVLSILGFPLTVVLAWAFDLTSRGVERTPSLEELEELGTRGSGAAPGTTPAAGPTAATAAPGAAEPGTAAAAATPGVAGPGAATGETAPAQPVAAEPEPSGIAVLPFADHSPDQDSLYFSEGMTEDLITHLCNIEGLRVISRTSVMQYRERPKNVREIGRDLGVVTILQGSVRRLGDRVRIAAQLIDARTDDHLWAEIFDRQLEDIFEIQSEVTRRIAKSLEKTLSARESRRIDARPTDDLEAYDLYLQGRFFWNRRSEPDLTRSAELLARAVEQDPDFALALAGLADTYVTLGIYGMRPPNDVMTRSRERAREALELDPELAEALTAQACVKALYDWDWAGAETDFERAAELNPNYPVAKQWCATNLLVPQRRFAEARSALIEAKALDPLSPSIAVSLGSLHHFERDFETAVAEFRGVADAHPGFGMAYFFLGRSLAELDRAEEAVVALERARELAGSSAESVAELGCALALAGREEEARRCLSELKARGENSYVSPARLARLHLRLGDRAAALASLEEAAELRAADLAWLDVLPVFDELREESRFLAIRKRIFG